MDTYLEQFLNLLRVQKLVNLRDRDMLMVARDQAERVITQDPELITPEHQALATKVLAFWSSHQSHGDAS